MFVVRTHSAAPLSGMVCVWIWPAMTVLLAAVTEFAGLVKMGAIVQMTAPKRAVVMLSVTP